VINVLKVQSSNLSEILTMKNWIPGTEGWQSIIILKLKSSITFFKHLIEQVI